ncbi:CDP-diacylglycerol--glycerol-3-phosphate 3-phosphatidyltransferase [Paenibacillus mesophilus]|uniref:CDP-diacylglycerol--glycerol-3-phosphate 3-phosphatidyltransferase n=1 Tax=Paenibacillus mesophilus TaxID=2582849 RepID=UPI00110EB785|nr:CDP-diacylglycerol--glycerol-3-phosphate 3-phosphatidyltransferase [Paenibacillus mesophilus]TMV51971.1 CDP-diacylglycerol--glycerol-3-phosphate 3-phosphatidyltransferase [Paenibacillus mesophilus]
MNLANKITIARIALVPLFMLFLQPFPDWMVRQFGAVAFIDRYGIYLAALLFITAAATDKIDGYVARTYNQITNLGKLLDPLADKLLIATALIMLVQTDSISSWAAVVIIGREAFITAIRVVAASKGIVLAADRYGKWKLVLQVAAIAAVLIQQFPIWGAAVYPIGSFLMAAAVLLTVYSGFHYVRTNYKQLQLNGV